MAVSTIAINKVLLIPLAAVQELFKHMVSLNKRF